MSNLTLNLPDDVLHGARIYAAENRTTVNALVRGFLENLPSRRDEVKKAMQELREMTEKSESDLGPDFKWDRESLYDRKVLR